jgi:hypothetical protein
MTCSSQVIPLAYHNNIKKVIFNNTNIDETHDDEYVSPRTFFLKPQSASSMSLSSSVYAKATKNTYSINENTTQNQYNASYRMRINFQRLKSKIHIGTSILMNQYTSESFSKKCANVTKNKNEYKHAYKENKLFTKKTNNNLNKSLATSNNLDSFNSNLTKKTTNSRILSSNSYFQNSISTNPQNHHPVTILNDPSINKFTTDIKIGNLSIDLINLEKKLIKIQSQSAPIRKRNNINNLNESFSSSHLLATATTTTINKKPASSKLINNNYSQLKSSSLINGVNTNIDADLKQENREAEMSNKHISSELTIQTDTTEKITGNKTLIKSKTTVIYFLI